MHRIGLPLLRESDSANFPSDVNRPDVIFLLDYPLEGTEELLRLVTTFGQRYRNKACMWAECFRQLCSHGNRIVVWGAGSKGVTFLNTVRNGHQVGYGIDINPRKQGMYVAGTGQQIVSPKFLREHQPDTVLVMNPIYADEIRDLLRHLLTVATPA